MQGAYLGIYPELVKHHCGMIGYNTPLEIFIFEGNFFHSTLTSTLDDNVIGATCVVISTYMKCTHVFVCVCVCLCLYTYVCIHCVSVFVCVSVCMFEPFARTDDT